jgi:hypothetical protein
MKKEEKETRDIQEALSGHCKLSTRTINCIWKRYRGKENYYDVGHHMGRPRKMNDHDRHIAKRQLANCNAQNATELQHGWFPDISLHTVKRELCSIGLKAHPRATVPLIPKKNLGKRWEWADQFRGWTVENWYSVLFSDESIFRVFDTDGMDWCWREKGEHLDPRFTKKAVKHGGGKVTVWGIITPNGPGWLGRIFGNMDAVLYHQILDEDLLRTLHDLDIDIRQHWFQQDNDPKHTSNLVQHWFTENSIDVLPWAPNSPDMNIIEHVWDHLDRQVQKRNPQPHNEDQLWVPLQEEWANMDVAYIQNLYNSMPRRVAELHRVKGGTAHY